jgi:hypothetical protein
MLPHFRIGSQPFLKCRRINQTFTGGGRAFIEGENVSGHDFSRAAKGSKGKSGLQPLLRFAFTIAAFRSFPHRRFRPPGTKIVFFIARRKLT